MCVSHYFGFCMECYTQTGFGQHGQVIRSVSYSNSLCYVHTFYLSDQFQQFGFTFSVNYISQISSG